MLREITREQLAAYPSRAIGVLGVAGGDGLDLIDPATTDVVYGYDITRTICTPATPGIATPSASAYTSSSQHRAHGHDSPRLPRRSLLSPGRAGCVIREHPLGFAVVKFLRPAPPTPERWFLRHGLVSMLRGTHLAAHASVRGAPALIGIFLIEMLWLMPDLLETPYVLGTGVSAITLVFTWVGANLVRRRRPFAAVARFGRIEALAFVLVPTAMVLATSHSAMDVEDLALSAGDVRLLLGITVFGAQLLLLAAVFALVVTGFVSLLSLLGRELIAALSRASGVLTAVIPIMLGFVFFFFFNPGVWLGIANLDTFSFVALVVFLLALGGGFSGSRRQVDLDAHAAFETTEELTAALVGTPLPDGAAGIPTPAVCPLDSTQLASLRMVAVLSRLVTAAVLGSAVFGIFLVMGFIVIGADTTLAWARTPPSIVFGIDLGGGIEHMVTWQQLRVAGFLAAFSSFNYMLVAATDGRLRQDAADATTAIVRQACALRLAVLGQAPTQLTS